jgi:predicted transcriptional regulator
MPKKKSLVQRKKGRPAMDELLKQERKEALRAQQVAIAQENLVKDRKAAQKRAIELAKCLRTIKTFGLRARDLAAHLKVTPSLISRWKQGWAFMPEKYEAIIKQYHDDLLARDEEE